MACAAEDATTAGLKNENDNKMTTNINNINNATCLVCYDDREAAGDTLVGLGCCFTDHVVCRACLVFYLTQCENDRVTTAVCPAQGCDRALAEYLMESVLGRPYTPKVWGKTNDNDNDGATYNDAALEQWLEDNEALKCPNCHAYIIKEEGCSAVQCLCGMRQCWNCRAPVKNKTKDKDYSDDEEEDDMFEDVEYDEDGNPSRCTCGHLADEFYDNILEEEGRPQPKLATLDELRDMATLYERRKDEDCSDYEEDEDDDEDDDESVVYAMDQVEEDSDDESEEGIVSEEEETCEPAGGVFAGTFLDWEEPEEAAVALVPLFFFSEEEAADDEEIEEDSEEEDAEPAEDENDSDEEDAEPAEDENKQEAESGDAEPNPAATAEPNAVCDEPLVAVEAPQQPSKERLPQRRCQSAPAAVLVANTPSDKDKPNQGAAAAAPTGEVTEKERPPRAALLWDFICSKIKKNQKQ